MTIAAKFVTTEASTHKDRGHEVTPTDVIAALRRKLRAWRKNGPADQVDSIIHVDPDGGQYTVTLALAGPKEVGGMKHVTQTMKENHWELRDQAESTSPDVHDLDRFMFKQP